MFVTVAFAMRGRGVMRGIGAMPQVFIQGYLYSWETGGWVTFGLSFSLHNLYFSHRHVSAVAKVD